MHYVCLGVTEQPTKAPFFYLVGCAAKFNIKEKADDLFEFPHKFIGSAS